MAAKKDKPTEDTSKDESVKLKEKKKVSEISKSVKKELTKEAKPAKKEISKETKPAKKEVPSKEKKPSKKEIQESKPNKKMPAKESKSSKKETPAPKAKKLTKKELEEIKKEEEKTLEEELEEQLTDEEIENFQIEKVDMERLTNKICDILAEHESEGMFQSELWKKLKLTSRDGSRLALKLERMGTIYREKLLEKGRWTYKLILKKTPISTLSIENAPCLVCPVEQKCSLEGEISPRNCQFIEDWVLADMKKTTKDK
jgi:DNA-binding MarR family transcriptional regulator